MEHDMKHLELVLDERYGRSLEDAIEHIHAAAVVRGVPEGTKPTIDVSPDPDTSWKTITTYRWEWEG
jgi:hypothetical protein